MDPDYLPFHPNPSKPAYVAPAGAVDAHCHVFGPADTFPYAPERKYTPFDAPKEKLFELRDHLGLSRNVIVQATCHGKNNDAMVDALEAAGDLARGVAMIGPETSDDELQRMDAAGVRAARFNFLKRLVGDTPKEVYVEAAQRIADLGWHNVVYFEAPELAELTPFLTALPGIVVVDHMGRPDVSKPVDDPEFQRFLDLMADHENFWVKVSCPERLTVAGPPYDDVVPFSRALVDNFPDRVIWGTEIATTEEKRQALLVDNPMRLYWNE
jgi:2-pyrone-4,6-dicarboxylate lactonase